MDLAIFGKIRYKIKNKHINKTKQKDKKKKTHNVMSNY